MSGGGSANNNWTILTPEESVAETLRPLTEGTIHHAGSLTPAAGSEADHPAKQSPVEGQVVSQEETAHLSGEMTTEHHSPLLTTVTDTPVASEASRSFVPSNNALSQSEGLPEGPTRSSPDPDSFSDSYTHISTFPDEPPVSLLHTERLEGGEVIQEEERLTEEGTLHLQNGEELQQEGKAADLSPRMTDLREQADSPVDSEMTMERMGDEGEPEVRRRSLLAALERIGRTEEAEEVEEEFQLPRREEDSGFSVNKCILGAVILLGLGTIFFSGFLMDLDEERDYGTRELKDSEVPVKQEWLKPDVPPAPVGADSTEMLNKISVLQAQLQTQKEELKVAKGQAAEGALERLRWEEVEKENSRLKTEMASFPVLQKENERMKRELESVPALQKELEMLRSTVTELKLSSAATEATVTSVNPTTSPPSGQAADTRQDTAITADKWVKKPWDEQKRKKDVKKDKYDTGEKKGWKEREKSEWQGEQKDRKEVGKTEWKTGKESATKHEQGKPDKEKDKQKKHGDETKQRKEKERKKEKASRGDEGKPWKAREGQKEWMEKSERKELKEEKDWKKAKHDKVSAGKQWRDKEEKVGNDHGERNRGKEEWRGEKEWKKLRDGFKENGKDKWEKRAWKEKEEKREWKTKNGKDQNKEGRVKGERKLWEESENRGKQHSKESKEKDERKRWRENEWKGKNTKDDKEWKRAGERKQWEKREEEWKRGGQKEKWNGEWKKDGSSSQQQKDEHKFPSNHHHDTNVWGDRKPPHTRRPPSLEEPEYWDQQRARLQHNPKPPQHCSSLETCAQAEGLLPVSLSEFEEILQNYLFKAEEAGVEASVTEELKKLTTEFFQDGVFVHEHMSFQDFIEDVSDILEHMVEGGENEEEEDGAIEEEMEEFEREVLKRFSAARAGEKEERVKGERRKESGRGRG